LAHAQNKPSKCANLGAQDLTRESDFGARFVCWCIGFLFAGSCVCRLFCKSSWAFLLLPFVFLPWHLAAFCVVNVAKTWGLSRTLSELFSLASWATYQFLIAVGIQLIVDAVAKRTQARG